MAQSPPGSGTASNFKYRLEIVGTKTDNCTGVTEVSGLGNEASGNVKGTGDKNTAYRLPVTTKYNNITLKRGIIEEGSAIGKWCGDTLRTDLASPVMQKDLLLTLVNEAGTPVASWTIYRAWPVKWEIAGLAVTGKELAIEYIEFAFADITRTT